LSCFENHIAHCKNRQLKSAASLLIPFIENPDTYRRHETRECFIELDGDLHLLALGKITDNFKFQVIKVLIQHGSKTIGNFVEQEFRENADSEIKLRYAFT
jgi:hypothetical protein